MVRLFSNTDARVWAVACTLACSYCSCSTGSASPALWSTASCQLTAAIQWHVPQLASHPSLLPSSALPGLQDENQKVKTITALTISALAEASGALRMRCCRLRLGCWFVPWLLPSGLFLGSPHPQEDATTPASLVAQPLFRIAVQPP